MTTLIKIKHLEVDDYLKLEMRWRPDMLKEMNTTRG
jgi:hypothetical protein